MAALDDAEFHSTPYLENSIESKIAKFASLPAGWHFGEGKPPSGEKIQKAIGFANEAIYYGFEVDAFPGISGEIQINLYCKENYFEFLLEDADVATLVHEENGKEVDYQEGVPLGEIFNRLKGAAEKCRLSGSLTQDIMTRISIDLPALPFETVVMEPEFRLFPRNVLMNQSSGYVTISGGSTTPANLLRHYFGSSSPTVCRVVTS